MANLWPNWISKESIPKTGKKMGVSSSGLSTDWMQIDKFEKEAGYIENEDSILPNPESIIVSTPLIQSPVRIRQGSAAYWRNKYEQAIQAYAQNLERSIQLEEISGLPQINNVKPKTAKENVRVTQVFGWMNGKNILQKVAEIKN